MTEVHEAEQAPVDPWAQAEAGIHMIGFNDRFLLPLTLRTDLLNDAEGHLDRLKNRYGDDSDVQNMVYSELIKFGIAANMPELIELALPEMDGFNQYLELYAVMSASQDPRTDFSIPDGTWQQLVDGAHYTAEREVANPNYDDADGHYTRIAEALLEFGTQLHRADDETAKKAHAEDVRTILIEEIRALDSCGPGRIDGQIGAADMARLLVAQYDQVCGEAGLWMEMIDEQTAQYYIFKAATEEMEPTEHRALTVLASDPLTQTRLAARAVLALDREPSTLRNYRRQLKRAAEPLFYQQAAARDAFRWVAPDLWAESLSYPDLEYGYEVDVAGMIDVDRRELGPLIRNMYAEVCFGAVKNYDHGVDATAFSMALQMIRSNAVIPRRIDRLTSRSYVETAARLTVQLERKPETPDDQAEPVSVPTITNEVHEMVNAWLEVAPPNVNGAAELEAQVSVVVAASTNDSVSFDLFDQLSRNLEIQWTQITARRSQHQLMKDYLPRMNKLWNQVEERLAVLRTAEYY